MMTTPLLLLTILSLVTLSLAQNECQTNRLESVKKGETKIRGSNLGSWFVLEGLMAMDPWLDNGCDRDEYPGTYLLGHCLGYKGPEVMERHWSTWITEEDFKVLSEYGVNVVRIPIGWWMIYDDVGGSANASLNWNVPANDFIVGGLAHLDQAFEWAARYGMGVLIDLHAAPGSQNGNDHSSPAIPGVVNWDKDPNNVGQSVDSMGLYADRYANHTALYGFALLNEPNNTDINILHDYYMRAYDRIRKSSPDTVIVISSLQAPFEHGTEEHWTGFMNEDQGYTNVAMDLHFYSCFGGKGDTEDPEDAINYIRIDRAQEIADYERVNSKKLLIGEWSNCGRYPEEYVGDYAMAQVEVYGTASLGWTFWSWNSPDSWWALQKCFEYGWIPPQYPC